MYQVVVFLHLLATVVWIGGMVFLALVAIPPLRRLPDAQRAALVTAMGMRFRVVGWVAIVVLIATGTLTLAYRGVSWEAVTTGRLWETPFGRILAWKLAFVGAMLVLSALHDFVIGPASTRLAQAGYDSTPPQPHRQALALRRLAAWIGRLNLLLALGALLLAVALVRGLPH
ncbi:MAG: CopD family protein [Armatimonadota bacterium]|nr:CopD family protein [Armatimonadota bacterium]MDR7533290.1 CopD family protein [Armatimonadota bacterium]MDR7536591.1 CopD family protein [Armatimonadota bacterium]